MTVERQNVLTIRDLSVSFATPRGPARALRNVSIDVPRGSIVGVVGESGCGKSTLIWSIVRLLAENARVDGGTVAFGGENLLELSTAEMRRIRGDRISMIFQDPMTALNPVKSIGRQMTDIQYRSGASGREKRERAIDMLRKVRIPDPESRLSAYPHQFSGGMRQRIAIAMALLVAPELLIADEPTTALDATLEVQIIHLLQELQREMGCSIIFVSHHLGVVAELCDYVVVMYAGEVVEHGAVRDIFHRPGHPYTQALLQCDPGRIKERTRNLPTIPGALPDLADVPAGCIFKNRCPYRFETCDTVKPPFYPVSGGRESGGPDSKGHGATCHLLADPERARADASSA